MIFALSKINFNHSEIVVGNGRRLGTTTRTTISLKCSTNCLLHVCRKLIINVVARISGGDRIPHGQYGPRYTEVPTSSVELKAPYGYPEISHTQCQSPCDHHGQFNS